MDNGYAPQLGNASQPKVTINNRIGFLRDALESMDKATSAIEDRFAQVMTPMPPAAEKANNTIAPVEMRSNVADQLAGLESMARRLHSRLCFLLDSAEL